MPAARTRLEIKDISRCMEIIRIRVGENGRLRTRWIKWENRINVKV